MGMAEPLPAARCGEQPLPAKTPPAPFMAGNTSAPRCPGRLCQRPPLPSAGTGGGYSHVPLALAAFESTGLGPGASWEGAATPGIGWGWGHSPRGCWSPPPDFQPASQSQPSQGRATGRAARHQPWERLREGEAGWDFAEGAPGKTGIRCPPPSAVPSPRHVVPDVRRVVPAHLPGAQCLVHGSQDPVPANRDPVTPIPSGWCAATSASCPILGTCRAMPGTGAR